MSDLTWHNEQRKLSDLVPWEHNPKRMTKKQADGLRASIEHFGFAVPFLVSPDGDIYDGHQRQTLMSAIKEYGPNATVDVRVSSRALTDDERRELVVRLKQNQAGWDFDMLGNLYEREELLEWGFEPEELGLFGDDDVSDDPGPQIDRAEELREKWGVETGQLWQLSEHRLICGDCTDAAVVARVMDGEKAVLMVTDPPYGVEYDPMFRKEALGAADRRAGRVQNDTRSDWRSAWSLFGGDVVYCWSGMLTALEVLESFKSVGFCVHAEIVWSKPHLPFGRGHYVARHESCWYLVRNGKTAQWSGEGIQTTVWDIALDTTAEGGHGTQKPIECMERPIRNHDAPIVYDPFLGSGTTLIACERLGRKCRAIEISPAYCAVAIQRWVDMTGGTPVLTGDNSHA